MSLIDVPAKKPLLDLLKTPETVCRKHCPGDKKHGEKIQEGILGGLIRIVDGEYDKNDDKIDDVVEHDLVEEA
jgi:hypothetical protein